MFKGLPDGMLKWQTARLLEIEDHRATNIVHIRPEIVYEISFDGVQDATSYSKPSMSITSPPQVSPIEPKKVIRPESRFESMR